MAIKEAATSRTTLPPLTFIVRGATAAPNEVGVVGETCGPGDDLNLTNNLVPSTRPNVVDPVNLQIFRLAAFGDVHNTGIAANDATPANDEIPNIIKFALGLDPFTPSVLNSRVDQVMENNRFGLELPADNHSSQLFVEESETLAAGDWNSSSAVVEPLPGGRYRVTFPLHTSGRGFVRLRAVPFTAD